MDSSDDSKSFLKHVFNFDDDSKSEILKIIYNQYFQEEALTSQPHHRFFLNIGAGNLLTIPVNCGIFFIYVSNITIGELSGQNRWIKLST